MIRACTLSKSPRRAAQRFCATSRRPTLPGPGELSSGPTPSASTSETPTSARALPRELPFVVGTEVCGTVAAVGDDVAAIGVGDRVVTANAVGAYAEFCTAPADFVAYVPDAVVWMPSPPRC